MRAIGIHICIICSGAIWKPEVSWEPEPDCAHEKEQTNQTHSDTVCAAQTSDMKGWKMMWRGFKLCCQNESQPSDIQSIWWQQHSKQMVTTPL